MDPRVRTPAADLQQQFYLSNALYKDMLHATEALHEITVLREQMKSNSIPAERAKAIESKLLAIVGPDRGENGRRGPAGPPTLGNIRVGLARLEHSIQNADVAPTTAQVEACHIASQPLAPLLEQWQTIKNTDLKALNQQLRQRHLPQLVLNTHRLDHGVEDQIEIGDID